MSLRWSILGVFNGISVYIAGQYLGSNAPLTAYAIVICGASLFTVFAFFPARQYEVPPERRDTHAPPQSIRKAFTQIVFFVRNYRAFRLFIICQAVFQAGLTMSVPLFPLHWVRVLNADDNSIGTVSMIQSVTLLFGYMAGTYIATRFKGRVVILWVCSIALGTYPLITALVGSMAPLLFFAAIWGVATAGIELVLLDMLLDSCPPGQVTAVMPAYQIAMFTVSLLGPLIGTIVAQNSNTTIALMLAAGLHFCGAALFIFFKIGRTHNPDNPVTS
jgi:MFS-type transporter involved in bile tolerance (Atg22 family)